MALYNTIDKQELRRRLLQSEENRVTLSFYRYHPLDDPDAVRDRLYRTWAKLGVYGRVYIAHEGINAQISVPEDKLAAFCDVLQEQEWLKGLRLNIALEDDGKSFFKLTIKVRPKIVADGLDDERFDVTRRGRHLAAEEVNRLMDREDTLVVDMRNHYESEVGHFEGAICPDVETFREALPLVEDMLRDKKENPIIMYCTGGIRCEKASAYYLHKGFKNVFMVDGGIIEYSRQCKVKGLPNRFRGKNFVFDERMGERVSGEVIARCHQCGSPCDTHVNCANDACHLLFIQCAACAENYDACCSRKCAEFNALSPEERDGVRHELEFNGTRFGKGRYKALRQDEKLDLR